METKSFDLLIPLWGMHPKEMKTAILKDKDVYWSSFAPARACVCMCVCACGAGPGLTGGTDHSVVINKADFYIPS